MCNFSVDSFPVCLNIVRYGVAQTDSQKMAGIANGANEIASNEIRVLIADSD